MTKTEVEWGAETKTLHPEWETEYHKRIWLIWEYLYKGDRYTQSLRGVMTSQENVEAELLLLLKEQKFEADTRLILIEAVRTNHTFGGSMYPTESSARRMTRAHANELELKNIKLYCGNCQKNPRWNESRCKTCHITREKIKIMKEQGE